MIEFTVKLTLFMSAVWITWQVAPVIGAAIWRDIRDYWRAR